MFDETLDCVPGVTRRLGAGPEAGPTTPYERGYMAGISSHVGEVRHGPWQRDVTDE